MKGDKGRDGGGWRGKGNGFDECTTQLAILPPASVASFPTFRVERFVLAAQLGKASAAHTRIIWSCSWTHDDVCFATASRDKRVGWPGY